MYEGKIVQVGTPETLFEKPEHTFVGYFIGSPGMNIVPCALKGNIAIVEGNEIPLLSSYAKLDAYNKIELGIRPEYLTLDPPDGEGLTVNILKMDDIGHYKIARVALNNVIMNVIVPEMSNMTGDKGKLSIDLDHVNIYGDDHLVTGEKL
jgi:glycerol transport system ATP-binding protein